MRLMYLQHPDIFMGIESCAQARAVNSLISYTCALVSEAPEYPSPNTTKGFQSRPSSILTNACHPHDSAAPCVISLPEASQSDPHRSNGEGPRSSKGISRASKLSSVLVTYASKYKNPPSPRCPRSCIIPQFVEFVSVFCELEGEGVQGS